MINILLAQALIIVFGGAIIAAISLTVVSLIFKFIRKLL